MRIAVVTTRHAAQDDRIYYKEAVSLARHAQVTVVAPDDGAPCRWAPSVGYRPIPRRNGMVGRLRSLLDAARAVRELRPDVCHVHDLDLVLALPLLRLVTDARLIFDSHEVFTEDDLMHSERIPRRIRPAVARLASLVERKLLHWCDQIVTAVEPGPRCFDESGPRWTTVFNYPPLSLFETDAAALESARQAYRERLPIIYQGTVSRERGLFQMIDALPILARSEPRILLRLVGMKDDALAHEALARAEALGVRGALEVSGWAPHQQMAYAMKTSVIGLVPLLPTEKHKRSLPIKLLEYMACGLPVVAARLPLMEKYVHEADAGLLYDSTRPEELAHCVLELLSNPERRREMGENGRRAVREKWNWDRMEEVLFGVYRALGVSGWPPRERAGTLAVEGEWRASV